MMHATFAVRDSREDINPARVLVGKLVEALESVESFPVFNYTASSGGSGVRSVTRRLQFRLKLLSGDTYVD
jgi:hypothetical protein